MTSAAIVAVGSELTTGRVTDTNSTWLERRLIALGLRCVAVVVVPDDLRAIQDAVAFACARAGVVVLTGGLGPTDDDITRDAVAALAGVRLELHGPSLERVEGLFRSIGRTMSPSNRRQAELPRGAVPLQNDWGTAPGFAFEHGGARLFSLPGVPREMRAMWEQRVEPELVRLLGIKEGTVVERTLRTCQLAESVLGERVRDLVPPGDPEAEIAYCVKDEEATILLTFTVRSADATRAAARADELAARARDRLGRKVCVEGTATLPERTLELLLARRRTVAIAESCTGGRVASWLAAVPGVSAALREGLVVYSDDAKTRLAGVDPALIRAHGAVSEEVARALAVGARAGAGADYGIGVTGIAGPSGGSDQKPVGTVHLALAAPPEVPGGAPRVEHAARRFGGDRGRVQVQATATALDLLRLALEDEGRQGA